MNKKVLTAIVAISLISPLKLSASSNYYDEPLSSYERVTIDDITKDSDVGIYNSADFDTVILQTPSGVSRISGKNLEQADASNYEMAMAKTYSTKAPDVYLFTDAAIDNQGNVYDLEMTINSVEALPGADNPYIQVHSDARITHEDVDISASLKVVDKAGEQINRPLTMIYEDMDMMTQLTFDIDQIDKVYAPYTSTESSDVTNPASFFHYDTLSSDLIEEEMNNNAAIDMKDERLRYYINNNHLSIYDSWNTMHKFDQTLHPELYDLKSMHGFYDIEYLRSFKNVYNLQNTPEQNFSVVFNCNPITINISQNVEAFGGQSAEANNLYLASPDFLAAPIDPINVPTNISKTASDESGDEIVSVGETVNYQIAVTNPDNLYDAHDVHVRDSLLENTPSYLKYNDDLQVNGDVKYDGSLSDGSFVITSIKPGQTVTLSYSMTLTKMPETEEITNIVTDNNSQPNSCDDALIDIDCDLVTLPIEEPGTTVISKTVIDENENGLAQNGEILTYQVLVENKSEHPAFDVVVRDSMLENTPSFVTYNNDLKISPETIKTNGDITKGNLTINKLDKDQSALLTYSVTVNYIPNDLEQIENIVTDNGKQPIVCPTNSQLIDCDQASIDVKHPLISIIDPEDKESEIVQSEVETTTPKDNIKPITNVDVSTKESPDVEVGNLATTGDRLARALVLACMLGIVLIAMRLIFNRIK